MSNKSMWNSEAVKAYELGQGVVLVEKPYPHYEPKDGGWTPERIAGMARLKDAQDKKLAQPEQEPVGQLLENAFGRGQVMWFNKPKDESMLYTTPPQRTWVGLTDEEILAVNMSTVTKLIDEPIVCDTDHNIVQLGKAIEAKLKEKNT